MLKKGSTRVRVHLGQLKTKIEKDAILKKTDRYAKTKKEKWFVYHQNELFAQSRIDIPSIITGGLKMQENMCKVKSLI